MRIITKNNKNFYKFICLSLLVYCIYLNEFNKKIDYFEREMFLFLGNKRWVLWRDCSFDGMINGKVGIFCDVNK